MVTLDPLFDTEFSQVDPLGSVEAIAAIPDGRFDRVVRLARALFDVPMARVNRLDADRRWATAGGSESPDVARPTVLCDRVLDVDGTVVVRDTAEEDWLREVPALTGPDAIRFYAGHVLHAPDGQAVGSLCILDHRPRDFGEDQVRMLQDLAVWVEKELAIDEEMIAAAKVQQQLFPSTPPDSHAFDVAGACMPARNIGGDFFDWHDADGELQVVLGDVMGKGMAAALIAASIRVLLRGASQYNELARAITRSAFVIEDDLRETASFVTAFCVRLDPETGRMTYVDAGHGLALVFEPGGGHRLLAASGLPLGVVTANEWESGQDELRPGETLLIVSDGLFDYFDTPEQAIGAAREVSDAAPTAQAMVDQIMARAAEVFLVDDVTLVVVRRSHAP